MRRDFGINTHELPEGVERPGECKGSAYRFDVSAISGKVAVEP
ncbi:MAG: hypothetical protein PHC90_10465 [Syntrophorhabdaceae bacterium]|nr:hypothetical protein [Syntrophorhabdaceae bacterium]